MIKQGATGGAYVTDSPSNLSNAFVDLFSAEKISVPNSLCESHRTGNRTHGRCQSDTGYRKRLLRP
jgi:hypothetical protein